MTHVLLLLVCMTPSSLANEGAEDAVSIEAQFGVNWEPEPTPAALIHLGWGGEGQLLAVDVGGRVWTREGHHRWVALGEGVRQGAADLSDDEDVLLDIEARLEELTDEGDPLVFSEEDLEGLPDTFADVGQEELMGELEAGAWFLDPTSAQGSGAMASAGVWQVDGLPWVVRDGGVEAWTGLRWERVFEGDVSAGAGGSRGEVGLAAGEVLWTRSDDGRWAEAGSLAQLEVRSIRWWDGRLWVATRQGLWVLEDGAGLQRTALTGTVQEMAVDGEQALWVRTWDALVRVERGGEQVRWPLPGQGVGAMALGSEGRVFVAGSGGVWSGTDGEWTAIVGAPVSPVIAMVADADRVWLLNENGLQGADLTGSDQPNQGWADTGALPPLDWLVRAAMHRPEVLANPGSRSKSVWLPRVDLEANYLPGEGRQYEPESGTTADTEAFWGILSRLTWSPPGRRDDQNVYEEAALEERASQVLIRGDGAGPTLMDPSALPRAAAAVSRTGRSRGSEVGQVVVALYRERLSYETLKPPEGLRAEVLSHLDRDVVEALIDVYTEGAYSRWTAGELHRLGETK